MLNAMRLDPDRAMVLVIDLQESLLPLIEHRQTILDAAQFLIAGSAIFELPVLATEQYPKGIGPTDASVRSELAKTGAEVLEKLAFSCCGDEGVRAKLRQIDREQIIVTGIETHVCVQQTALDLLSMDYDVFVCADAVGSRGRLDHDTALERLAQAGAVMTTVESVLFELCGQSGTDRFKTMLALIKSRQDVAAKTRA